MKLFSIFLVDRKDPSSGRQDCFDQLNQYFGVTLCYEVNTKKGDKLANSRLFPLNGPAHVSAHIEIEKQYHFSALYDDSNAQKRSLELVFDTPESQPSRKVSIKFEGAISPKAYLSASFNSPYKTAKAELGLTNDDQELVVYGQANTESVQYLLKFGFKKSGSGPRREYTPIIEFNNPGSIPYKVSGRVIADSSKSPKTRYNFEKLTVEPATAEGKFGPLVIDGFFEHDSKSFDTALDVRYKDNTGNIKGKVAAEKSAFDADISLVSDFNELANGRIKLNFVRAENRVKDSFVLIYGRDLESTTKRFEVTSDYEYQTEEKKLISLSGKNTLIIAPLPLKIIINGGFHKNHVDYDVLLEYARSKVASKLNADVDRKNKGDWNVKFNANLNSHSVDVTSTRDIDGAAQKSTVQHEVKSSFGTHIVLNSKFDNVINAQKADIASDGTIVLARGQKPLKYNFKFSLTPKLAQSNGKVIADTAELLSFNGVLNRNGGDLNAPITGTLDFTVPEFVTAHGEYNTLKGNGKSELVVTFPKFQRKVKVDTKYECNANKFDLRNDFYYNFEKDNSRHIAFDTKNKYTSTSFDSANEVDINGEKFHFGIDGSKSGDLKNGKHNGKFLLRLPTQREISGTLDRQVDLSSPTRSTGHGNIKIIDTINQSGRKSRSIELDGTLKDGNREQRLFDVLHKLVLTDFDGKQIVVNSHVNHLPKGEFKSALASVKVSGSIPHPVELTVGIDEYCAIHAVYNANFKYGNIATVGVNGDYAIGEAGKKPNTFKLGGQISVPQSKLKQLTFDTRGSLKYPDAQDTNGQIDYDFKFNSKLNEKNVAVDTKGKFGKNNGDLSMNVKLPDTESFAVDLDYNYDHQVEQQSHRSTGNVQVRYGNGKNIKFSGDAKVIEDKEISYRGSINTPYEKAKSLDLSFKAQKKDENTYANEVELNIDDKKYKLTNVVVVSQLNPSFILDVYYPQDKHSKVAVLVTRAHDRKHKLSVRLENINNFQLTGDVELSYQSVENFGLIIDLDSAALKANKIHVDIHSKQNGNNKGIEFSATEQNRNIVSGTADYLVKQEKGKTTIEGKGNVNWYDKSSALTFQFMRSTFNQAENNETGVSVSEPFFLVVSEYFNFDSVNLN